MFMIHEALLRLHTATQLSCFTFCDRRSSCGVFSCTAIGNYITFLFSWDLLSRQGGGSCQPQPGKLSSNTQKYPLTLSCSADRLIPAGLLTDAMFSLSTPP